MIFCFYFGKLNFFVCYGDRIVVIDVWICGFLGVIRKSGMIELKELIVLVSFGFLVVMMCFCIG